MRKNKLLTEIEGGICAPDGFRANAVCAGIYEVCGLTKRENAEEDIALISAKGKYPTACVYAQGALQGAPVRFNRRYSKGYARAIFVNAGIANVCAEDADKNTLRICDELCKRLVISRDEIIMASTGEIRATFPTETVIVALDALVAGLQNTWGKSRATARAIMTTDAHEKEFAYTYMQGDYLCKFGVICKGNARVAPNMATTLCFITTDVNISPEMLQRALSSVVAETFNLIDGDGVSSPNDTVCVISSGLAGNYKISQADTEYKKFNLALKAVCTEACKRVLSERGRILSYRVHGAKSQRVARAVAKTLARCRRLKENFQKGVFSHTDVVFAIGGVEETFKTEEIQIKICSAKGEIVLIDEGKPLPFNAEYFKSIIEAEEITVIVDLEDGNYAGEAMTAL